MQTLVAQWGQFADLFEFEIRNLACAGAVVFAERVDRLGAHGMVAPVPVCSVFEVRDGKIVHWRDYLDPSLVAKMFAQEGVTALVPRV